MRAALFATAALAAGAHALVELGMCNVKLPVFAEPCQLAMSSTLLDSSDELGRAAVGNLWFTYRVATEAFATSTEGTIVVVTKERNVDNVFALPAVMAQVTIAESSYEPTESLLQQRELPACDAPTPVVTRAFPDMKCDLNSKALKGCGIVVKSTLADSLSSQELATALVGTLRFVFGKGASVLQTTTHGQVVLVIEENLTSKAVALFIANGHLFMGAMALPVGEGKVLSGPSTCTELRNLTMPMLEIASKSELSANPTASMSENLAVPESKEAVAAQLSAAQLSAAHSPSAHWAAAAAVSALVAAAVAQ